MNSILLIAVVVTMAAGHVFAVHWSGRRLGIPTRRNLRQTLVAALAVSGILGLSTAVGSTGLLSRFDAMPPYVLRFIMPHVMLAMILSRSAYGRRLALGLPIPVLVGYQAFRIPVEVILHRAYLEGSLPIQMTFAGRNLDIITGLTALPLAWLAARGRAPRWMLYLWNLVGLGLLINIVGLAIVSMPGPLRRFANNPPNTLIAHWPYIWLPTFLVTTALMGHLLLFRRLGLDRRQDSMPASSDVRQHDLIAR